MDACTNIIYKLASFGNGGTDRTSGKTRASVQTHKSSFQGFFYFSSLNSAGRSVGTAGGNREPKATRYSKGFQSWGVNRAPRTFIGTVYPIVGVKGEPLVVKSCKNKGGTKRADKSWVINPWATINTNRRYSFVSCICILLVYKTRIWVGQGNCPTTPWRCYACR